MESTTTPKKKTVRKKKKAKEPFTTEDGALIYGWDNMEDIVRSVYCSNQRDLLMGRLIFAFQNPSAEQGLRQIVIVKNPQLSESDEQGRLTYSIGIICKGYTSYIPCALYSFLENQMIESMNDWGIDETLMELYKNTILKFKIT